MDSGTTERTHAAQRCSCPPPLSCCCCQSWCYCSSCQQLSVSWVRLTQPQPDRLSFDCLSLLILPKLLWSAGGWSTAMLVIALCKACLPALMANCAGVVPSSALAVSQCFAPNVAQTCSAIASPFGRRAARCSGVRPPGPLQDA